MLDDIGSDLANGTGLTGVEQGGGRTDRQRLIDCGEFELDGLEDREGRSDDGSLRNRSEPGLLNVEPINAVRQRLDIQLAASSVLRILRY